MKKAKEELRESLKTRRRIVVSIFAGFLIVIGFIGQFIPLFPGRTLLFIGVVILSLYSPTLHAWMKRKTANYPKVQSFTDRVRNRLINLIHK